jgi:hypothetical protein
VSCRTRLGRRMDAGRGGLRAFFPASRIIIADAGHDIHELARTLKRHEGWELRIVKRRQRAFKITGPTWIVNASLRGSAGPAG